VASVAREVAGEKPLATGPRPPKAELPWVLRLPRKNDRSAAYSWSSSSPPNSFYSATTFVTMQSAFRFTATRVGLMPVPAVALEKLRRLLRAPGAGRVGRKATGRGFLPCLQDRLHHRPAMFRQSGVF